MAGLAALVAAKVIDPGLSAALTGLLVAVLGLVAAFGVHAPRRKKKPAEVVRITQYGGSE